MFAIREAVAHPWAIIAIIAILVVYSVASKKIKGLPVIPMGFLILYLLLKLFEITLPFEVDSKFMKWIGVAKVALLYAAIARILFSIIVEKWFFWKKGIPLPKITRDFVLFIIYAVIVLVVMRTRGSLNLAGLITTSAVLTASIGLAAQSTLSNLLSGLSIQLDRPFTVGDWIEFDGHVGQVIAIGWKTTRIRTFENEMVVLPNADITTTSLKNYSKPTDLHVMAIEIGAEYGAAPNLVKNTLLDVCGHDFQILKAPTPMVRLVDYGDFAITYELRYTYRGYGNSMRLRARTIEKIWYAFRRKGIRIPFPIRDVQHRHVERKYEADQMANLRNSAVKSLENIPIFMPLTEGERGRVGSEMRIEEFCAGENIVLQDEPGDCAYIIYDGKCDVVIKTPDDKKNVVATLAPPAIFGEMSLLTGASRNATVHAREDTRVFAIDKSILSEILTSNPPLAETFAETLATRQAAIDKMEEGRRSTAEAKSHILSRIKNFFKLNT